MKIYRIWKIYQVKGWPFRSVSCGGPQLVEPPAQTQTRC